ncbi:MAG: RNA-binding protein [Patescibacteria group bacterium]|nr:RNA-binding protein [Patescibacteria group bacterium]
MEKRLYVGGLSFDTTEEGLAAAFAQAGQVAVDEAGKLQVKIITWPDSGRSKGFGFVEMATEDDAAAAIKMWDGKELDGRSIKVNEARPREERTDRNDHSRAPRRGGQGGGGRW